MRGELEARGRVFKTAWFSKATRKAGISDAELCDTIGKVLKGQCDDLGGGVYKKRLNKNMFRGIILAKSGRLWVYEYLYAKKNRANIDDDELKAFRKIANAYEGLTEQQLTLLVQGGNLVEICHGNEA